MTRVFVVDDEPDMVALLETILRSSGLEVDSDTDGRSALARILGNPPDLILLDLMMPDLDGMEVLKLLRVDPKGSEIPVLVVSARSGHQDQLGSLQLGANAYICKPFSPRELMRQVHQLIGEVGGSASA